MADRLHQVGHFLDGMADGSLPGGVTFLSRAHNEDTRAEAEKLLMHALKYCKVDSKTKADAIGSPALWAILLAQQAHLSRYRWEVADLPEHWNVHAMHELLRERQGQRVTLEGGSRARRDTRTVGRGLRDAQQVRDITPPSPPRSSPPSSSLVARSWPTAAMKMCACARSAWTSSATTMTSKPRWAARAS